MKQKLKLSPETVAVLSNFSGINKSLVIRPGSELSTMSESKSIIGVARIAEAFETEAVILDLKKFLSALTLFSDPEIEIGDKQFTIRDGARKLNFTFGDKRTVLSIEKASIEKLEKVVDRGDVEFDWTDSVFQSVSRARAVLGVPELVVEGDGTNVFLRAMDTSNSTADSYEVALGSTGSVPVFRAVFRQENIRFLPRDYRVKYASQGLARFSAPDVTYYVTTEAKK
jgi:Straboviridae DNA polymerase processivity component